MLVDFHGWTSAWSSCSLTDWNESLRKTKAKRVPRIIFFSLAMPKPPRHLDVTGFSISVLAREMLALPATHGLL